MSQALNRLVQFKVPTVQSASEETVFGGILELVAAHIDEELYNGKKSVHEGIDREFVKDGVLILNQSKSSPKWANANQLAQLETVFFRTVQSIHKDNPKLKVVCINSCAYGKGKVKSLIYDKLCGQRWWEFLTGDGEFYLKLIDIFASGQDQFSREFKIARDLAVKRLATEFEKEFCKNDGSIDLHKIMGLNSGSERRRKSRAKSR